MPDRKKNILIGFFFIFSLFVVIGIGYFLTSPIGDGKKTYLVCFSNISGITKGSRVTFSGKPVGKVVDIQVLPDARNGPVDSLDHLYYYQLTLQVDSAISIYANDEICLRTSGLLGEKSVAIIPKQSLQGKTVNEVIYAKSEDPIEKTFSTLLLLSKEIKNLVVNMQKTTNTISNLIQKVEKENLIENLSVNIRKSYHILQQLDITVQNLNLNGTQTLENLTAITNDIRGKKGFLGKCILSDSYHLQLQSLLHKGQILINDINRYGLLFHYDKTWKREKNKRMLTSKNKKNPTS